MIEILKQAPRLRRKAAKRTNDINEAYLMVHNAMARAMDRSSSSEAASVLRPAVAHALSQIMGASAEHKIGAREIGHRVVC